MTTARRPAQAGSAPRIAFEGEEIATLPALVAVGLGVALLPPPHAVPFPPEGAIAPG